MISSAVSLCFVLHNSIADELERHSIEALGNTEEYLSNPVNAFLLIKRFSIDWNDNIRNFVNNNNSDG